MMKKKRIDVVPVGYRVEIRPLKGGAGEIFTWKVTKYGKLVKEGAEELESIAKQCASDAMLDHAAQGAKGHDDRNLARMKLRNLVEKRPYLCAGASELILLGGADLARLVSEAPDFELAWQKKDPPKYRKALPTHHRALTPQAAARQFWEVCCALGMIRVGAETGVVVTGKFKSWATKTFGDKMEVGA